MRSYLLAPPNGYGRTGFGSTAGMPSDRFARFSGMADHSTLTELLLAQSEKKLHKLRTGVMAEINRLGIELRLIEDAIAKKTKAKTQDTAQAGRRGENGRSAERAQTGTFKGLSRGDLLEHMRAVRRPVKPAEMQPILAEKGIAKNVEALRTAMHRLAKDGKLRRLDDGRFEPTGSSNGAEGAEAGDPLFGEPASEVGPDGA